MSLQTKTVTLSNYARLPRVLAGIKVDPEEGKNSEVLHLVVPAGGHPVGLSVVQEIGSVTWLQARLDPEPASGNSLIVQPGQSASLVLRSIGHTDETPALDAEDLSIAMEVTFDPEGDNPELNIENIELKDLLVATSKLSTPDFEVEQKFYGRSRSDANRPDPIVLAAGWIFQPEPKTEYIADHRHVQLDVEVYRIDMLHGSGPVECSLRLKRRDGSEMLARAENGRAESRKFSLMPGEKWAVFLEVFDESLGQFRPGEEAQYELCWTLRAASEDEPRREISGSEKIFRVEMVAGEIISVELNGDVLMPSMLNSRPQETRFTPEIVYERAGLHDGETSQPKVDAGLLKIRKFDTEWTDFKWSAFIRLPDSKHAVSPAAQGDIDFNNGLCELELPLADMLVKQNFHRHSGPLEASIEITGTHEDNNVRCRVIVPLAAAERKANYLMCVDFGASATAVWFGEAPNRGGGEFLALGDVIADQFSFEHAEFDRHNRPNILMPGAVGLHSDWHTRSNEDPLSLGPISSVGGDSDAVLERLQRFERTYDVSLPVVDGTYDVKFIIDDLKRRFLSKSHIKTGEVWQFEPPTQTLKSVTHVDYSRLLIDYFDELAVYVVPRALEKMANAGNNASFDPYRAWMELEPGDLQIIITHPSGIDQNRLSHYKAAGRLFARKIFGTDELGDVGEPKFVPEALAAAYYGVWNSFDSNAISFDSEKAFACIDIGASTFDASIVVAEISRAARKPTKWRIESHFGGTVGGADLDDALFAISEAAVRDIEPRVDDTSFPLRFETGYNSAHLSSLLKKRIAAAKVELSGEARREYNNRGYYGWPQSGDAGLSISLKGILEVVPGRELAAAKLGQTNGNANDVRIGFSTNKTTDPLHLLIPRSRLDAKNVGKETPNKGPETIARLLGHSVPAMLAREARRLNLRDVQWVITGRASLWPSIHQGIADMIRKLNAGKLLHPNPLSPKEMKSAIALGANALVRDSMDINDGSSNPIAKVVFNSVDVLNDFGVRLGKVIDIEYLDVPLNENETKDLPLRNGDDGTLVPAGPGLLDEGQDDTITREEIESLFKVFGMNVFGTRPELDLKQHGRERLDAEERNLRITKKSEGWLVQYGKIEVLFPKNRYSGV